MVDDLKEALSTAGLTDLLGTDLHLGCFAGEEATEVDDWWSFGGTHCVFNDLHVAS